MNVRLGSAFDQFVADLLKSGYFQTQSEILREGLRLLKEREDVKQTAISFRNSASRFFLVYSYLIVYRCRVTGFLGNKPKTPTPFVVPT
jgi:hypothetical protein